MRRFRTSGEGNRILRLLDEETKREQILLEENVIRDTVVYAKMKDRSCYGWCIRSEKAGTYPVWIRKIVTADR